MTEDKLIKELSSEQKYEFGFVTEIESDKAPKGLSEDTIRMISRKKNEPEWMLKFRLTLLSPLAKDD
jgi:Fe-S cluster assembly protein SufB